MEGRGDPDAGDAVTYDVYLDTVNPPTYLIASDLTRANFWPPTLSLHIYYYWKVVATDISEASTEGPVWSFETHTPEGQYTLSLEAGTGGTTYPRPAVYKYVAGDSVLLEAIPESNYSFSGWTGDVPSGDESKNPLTLVMDGDKSIKANFTAPDVGGSDDTSEEKGGCFIASAAYGSPLHSYVRILRDFRDKYLMPSRSGRMLVCLYYKYSPFAADLISRHKILKVCVRISLLSLVAFSYSMLHFGPTITVIILALTFPLPIFIVWFYRRRARSYRLRIG